MDAFPLRSGHRAWLEGGQMPLRRLPKRGFKSLNRAEYRTANLQALDRRRMGLPWTETLMEGSIKSGCTGKNSAMGHFKKNNRPGG